ncbi:MAG: IclR family transcriptional regulator [Bradyrhizobium sp.]|nr:IclR family transcriptional regulator [Bradyrhizobium sp.]
MMKSQISKSNHGTAPRRGIQSIEIGAKILRAVRESPTPLQLKDISSRTGMAPSKAFRYLVSFVETGLLRQNPQNGRYDLGPFCLELGLSALGRIDEMDVLWDGLVRVTEQLGRDAHFSVWGASGPMIARWKHGLTEIAIRVRDGAVLPLLSSATGRVWACYLPRTQTQALMTSELETLAEQSRKSIEDLRDYYEERISAVRMHGLARADQEKRQGISALSGPIFNRAGIAYAMTLLGPTGDIDLSYQGETAVKFRAVLEDLSKRLGQTPSFIKQ